MKRNKHLTVSWRTDQEQLRTAVQPAFGPAGAVPALAWKIRQVP
ncbi:hypothetical protein [Evansella clarkii]|nr:hypothetical protein [Evansella clarkii]